MLYNWHNISALVTALADNTLQEVAVGEKKIGLVRKGDTVYAFAATCPHSGAPLCEGWMDARGHIVCPLHKYRFDPANGYNSSGEGYKLRTFPIELREGEYYVGIVSSCSMNIPSYLQKGSTVGITCPSGYVSGERVSYAVTVLESWGLNVVIGQTVGTEHFYFSGNDDARFADLQCMLDDPGINAILMGRGGYGLSRIIDRLDLTKFKKHPKWICGFSDITVLHNHIQTLSGIPTMHSPMCGAFTRESENSPHILNFRSAILGEELTYEFPASPFNRAGGAEGIITGGNLAMLAHLTGSVSEVDTAGKILFIEDIGEHLYNIDRLLLNLKRAGKLDSLSALLVGSFTDNQDTERPFGQTVEEIIWDKVKEYAYPVAFNFPCGHQEVNHTLTLGMKHSFSVDTNGSTLKLIR